MSDSSGNDVAAAWTGDILGRKEYAAFLTEYLKGKIAGNDSRGSLNSFCMALDAKWGEGKTFFVSNWSLHLLQESQHLAFVFDAWKSDFQEDPILAFMAAFRSAIDKVVEQELKNKGLESVVKVKVNSGLKKIQKALLPASKAVLKGVLNKVAGGALDEIVAAYQDGELDEGELRPSALNKPAVDGVREGLDAYFELKLKECSEREKLFEDFRDNVQDALNLIFENSTYQPPFFIFIDEIDRCRPTFSLELLEGLKHIFNVPGVCYIVSTNISQLSHAVGAVYGVGFDGSGYLNRFFDTVYSLPRVNRFSYIELLMAEANLPNEHSYYFGLPPAGFNEAKGVSACVLTIDWVFELFDIDLRLQRRVLQMISACAGIIQSKHKVHLFWLVYLCSAFTKHSKLFDEVFEGFEQGAFKSKWEKLGFKSLIRTVFLRTGDGGARQVSIYDVIALYSAAMHKSSTELRVSGGVVHDFPRSILNELASESPRAFISGHHYPLSISNYPKVVQCAGFLHENIDDLN